MDDTERVIRIERLVGQAAGLISQAFKLIDEADGEIEFVHYSPVLPSFDEIPGELTEIEVRVGTPDLGGKTQAA